MHLHSGLYSSSVTGKCCCSIVTLTYQLPVVKVLLTAKLCEGISDFFCISGFGMQNCQEVFFRASIDNPATTG